MCTWGSRQVTGLGDCSRMGCRERVKQWELAQPARYASTSWHKETPAARHTCIHCIGIKVCQTETHPVTRRAHRHPSVAGLPSPTPLVGLLLQLLLPPSATAAAASASAPRLAAAAQLPGCGDDGREQGSDPGMGQLAAPVMRLMLVTSSSRSDSCSTRLPSQQERHAQVTGIACV